MRIGSLFSGYGGLDIAVQNVYGGSVVWYSEIEKAACTVLAERHPGVRNLGDIKAVDWSTVEPVDILTGGYPCQPFSNAGNRKGTEDERHLWPYVRDAIATLRPMVTILENVDGHRSLGLDIVLGDLAQMGMSARWGVVRASDTGAPHKRARVFIVAYPEHDGLNGATVTGSIGESQDQGRLCQFERCDPDIVTYPGGDGYGKQLHARAMASVEGQATNSTQQWERARREFEPRSPDDASDTYGSRLQGSDIGTAARRGPGASPTGVECASDNRTSTNGDTDGNEFGEIEKVPPVGAESSGVCAIDWGKYAPAIRRWETVLDRPAPAPTVERKDKRQLNPQFVEWMIGLELGHVTGHGLSAAQELKMLGNGVVPQQAELALRMLAVV